MELGKTAKSILAGILSLSIIAAPQTFSRIVAAGDTGMTAQLDQQKDDLDQKERELSARRDELDKKLLEIREDKSRQLEYRDTLKQQIGVLQEQIRNTDEQLEQLDFQIEDKSREIQEKQAQIDTDYELLKKRLRAIYMSGEASFLDVLLCAHDVNDFLDKSMILQRISQRDTQLINSLKAAVEEVSEEKAFIEQSREKVLQSQKKLESQKEELDDLQAECNNLIQSLEGQEGDTQQQQRDAARDKAQFDDELAEWHRQYVANQRAQQDASSSSSQASSSQSSSSSSVGSSSSDSPSSANPPSSSSSSATSKPDPAPPSSSSTPSPAPDPAPPASQTKYLWPLPGFTKITDYFGDRPIYGYHRGIDIAGTGVYRAKIVAAEDGVVIRVNRTDEWGSGWGYHVMIDHGDGYATQYAHCDEILVNVGDHVKRGDPIALVGDTGDSYGAHLHFEVWDNGTRIDPLPFLRN